MREDEKQLDTKLDKGVTGKPALENVTKETQDGKSELINQQKQNLVDLKSGKPSGITDEFGKPLIVDEIAYTGDLRSLEGSSHLAGDTTRSKTLAGADVNQAHNWTIFSKDAATILADQAKVLAARGWTAEALLPYTNAGLSTESMAVFAEWGLTPASMGTLAEAGITPAALDTLVSAGLSTEVLGGALELAASAPVAAPFVATVLEGGAAEATALAAAGLTATEIEAIIVLEEAVVLLPK